jgi:hypothetical protein
MRRFLSILCFSFLLTPVSVFAQKKELPVPVDKTEITSKKITPSKKEKKDTSSVNAHSPRKAALRSAILPGLGQIYNKKYWKLPIVYGALGAATGIFFFNYGNYKDTRFAYNVKYKMRQPGATAADSALYNQIKDVLKPLSEESLRNYRNGFRRDIDYSAVFFLFIWGLNVLDATVDAHLKSFDVSPNLSLQIKPGHSEMAGTNGVSLVLNIR